MAIKDIEARLNVVEAAKIRIKNAFNTGLPIILSISGGKDSIVLADIVYKLILAKEIDAKKLTVQFIDEEAIFQDVEKTVLDWRKKFLLVGSSFDWYCVEVKHFNCLNTLDDDETFILWDSAKKDRWVRDMPDFAIKDHKLLRKRKDSYQEFLPRINRGKIAMIGVRTQESSMRRNNIATLMSNSKSNRNGLNADNSIFPIYDFTDDDIWLYIKRNKLHFPITYIHLYQTGGGRRDMRLSQFFSIDTAKSLVKLNEYDPTLMSRVIKREPNAYLASMYWESEMFRRAPGRSNAKDANKIDVLDYKSEVFKMFKNTKVYFNTPSKVKTAQAIRRLMLRDALKLTDRHYKQIYQILLAGDPKARSFRGLLTSIASDYSNLNKKEAKNGNTKTN
jgi:predicted phosphoadenosine phosphosulfate sulfurtransferase